MITVKTLHQATAQEVFDQIAEHLLKQGKKSQTITGSCKYRGPDGLRCAAGCLLGDDEYDPQFEDRTWWTVLSMLSVTYGISVYSHDALISQTQEIHDSYTPDEWRSLLSKLATKFDLEFKFDSTDL